MQKRIIFTFCTVLLLVGFVSSAVYINEVELNPSGTDSGNEWVELYNSGPSSELMIGWELRDKDDNVLATVSGALGIGAFLVLDNLSGLVNTDENVSLWNGGTLVDSTEELSDSDDDGKTWQRIPDGTGGFVFNDSTKGVTNVLVAPVVEGNVTIVSTGDNYTTINDAVGNAADGDVILVGNGVYSEDILVGKELEIKEKVGEEAFVEGKFDVRANNVVISGFDIEADGEAWAIIVRDFNNSLVKNNIIHDVGGVSGDIQAVYIIGGENHKVLNNEISAVSSTDKTAKAIFVGGSSPESKNVLIENNTIYDINGDTGGYGILVNRASESLIVRNNYISDIEGQGWAHAISLDADTTNGLVEENVVSEIVGVGLGGVGFAVNVEDNDEWSSLDIEGNDFLSNGGVVNQVDNSIVDARNNYWGACDGPSGLEASGSGAAIFNSGANGTILYEPFVGACVEDQRISDICTFQGESVILYADVGDDAVNVTFSVNMNGSWMNYTGVVDGTVADYRYELGVVENDYMWNVYVEDSQGHLSEGGLMNENVNSRTELTVLPDPADGENGWFLGEPVFLLNNNDSSEIYYRWNGNGAIEYDGAFGLDDAPNNANVTGGIENLKYQANFSCGLEPMQNVTIMVDFTDPVIKDVSPEGNVSELTPEIYAYIDETYQSNSGINESSIVVELDGVEVDFDFDKVDVVDGEISFVPENLSVGEHEVYVYVEDNAGRSSEMTWTFNVKEEVFEDLDFKIVNPDEGVYTERRLNVEISSGQELVSIEYKDSADRNPRYRPLCRRDCSDFSRLRSFRDGNHTLMFRVTDDDGRVLEKSVNFVIDSRDPRIGRVEPRRGFANGEFSVEFREDNPVELMLYYGVDGDMRNESVDVGNECITDRRGYECMANVSLEDFDEMEISYWFELKDIAGNYDESRVQEIDVDMTDPILNNVSYEMDGRRVEFVLNVTELNLDYVSYIDHEDRRPRERRICTRLDDEGLCDRRLTFGYGEHNLTITAYDEAGNSASVDLGFEIERS